MLKNIITFNSNLLLIKVFDEVTNFKFLPFSFRKIFIGLWILSLVQVNYEHAFMNCMLNPTHLLYREARKRIMNYYLERPHDQLIVGPHTVVPKVLSA